MGTEPMNHFLKSTFGWIPSRIALAIMAWFGFINLYMTRINVSVIIVAMVRRNTSSGILASCLVADNVSSETTASTSEDSEPQESSAVSPFIKDDVMDWDETIQGLVLGSFFYGYFTTQGLSWPSMHACICQWIPPLERPRFIATVYCANNLSTAMTLPLCGLIIDSHGWPAAFYIIGSLSLIWCIFWFSFMYSFPAQHPRISPQELEYIEAAIKKSGTSSNTEGQWNHPVPWRAILTSMPMWAIIVGDFGNSWVSGLFFTQLPTYMKNILGFSIKANGSLSALPFISRYVGAILLSFLGDWLLTRGYFSVRTTRRVFSTIAMWVPAMMLLGVSYSGCNWKVIVILFCTGLFFNGAVTTSTIVNATDIAPNFSGTLFGITNSISTIANFIVPVMTGIMTDEQQTIGQWQKVFWICIPMYIVMHIFFFIFCSGDVQPWNYAGQNTRMEYIEENQNEKEIVNLTNEEEETS